jgi:flagellar motor switch protein FliM
MQRDFTQEEIDAIIRVAASRKNDGHRPETHSVKPCSFRQAGQLTGQQLAAVTSVHESFAHNLTQSLGAYLRVTFEASLGPIEQLIYSQFRERVSQATYAMAFRGEQMNAAAALQIDHSLVFPLVDILLGGVGRCDILARDVTEIEEQIMEDVAKIICRELEASWISLGTKLYLDGRQSLAQMQHFMPPTEKTLCLGFEIKLAETSGMLRLVLPVSISNTLLRKLCADGSQGKSHPALRNSGRMTAKMMDCPFPIELGIPAIKLPINILARLAPNTVCNLGTPVRKPASLIVAGRESFEANPVRHGHLRAAQVGQQLGFSEEGRKR